MEDGIKLFRQRLARFKEPLDRLAVMVLAFVCCLENAQFNHLGVELVGNGLHLIEHFLLFFRQGSKELRIVVTHDLVVDLLKVVGVLLWCPLIVFKGVLVIAEHDAGVNRLLVAAVQQLGKDTFYPHVLNTVVGKPRVGLDLVDAVQQVVADILHSGHETFIAAVFAEALHVFIGGNAAYTKDKSLAKESPLDVVSQFARLKSRDHYLGKSVVQFIDVFKSA